jgi:hypothetical protein
LNWLREVCAGEGRPHGPGGVELRQEKDAPGHSVATGRLRAWFD